MPLKFREDGITKEVIDNTSIAGMVASFAMATAPDGWIVANGAEVSRTAYPELDAAIGETWGSYTDGAGGTGTTHIQLPDLRGAFLRGTGTGTINARDKVGPAVGAFQEDRMQQIVGYHGRNRWGIGGAFSGAFYKPGNYGSNGASSSGSSRAAIAMDSARVTRTGADTHPYDAGVLYCIKY